MLCIPRVVLGLGLGFAGGALALAAPAFAGPISVSETVADFGTLNQRAMTDACDSNPLSSCGPTATVNSLMYLQKTHPKLYGTKLVPGGAGQPQATVNTLGQYMNCNCNGESTAQMLQGKEAYIQGGKDASGIQRAGVAPGTTTFASQFLSFNASGTAATGGTVPSLSFLLQQIMAGEDVEMVVGLYTKSGNTFTRTGGHVVTLTGAAYNDNNNNGKYDAGDTPRSISFIDPLGTTANLNGALTIANDNLTSVTTQFGSMLDITNYFASVNNPLWAPRNDTNTYALIDGAVAESAIVEPGSAGVLALAFASLALAIRRRANGRRPGAARRP